MIQLVGLRHDVKVEIREKLSINPKHWGDAIQKLLTVCDEAVVLSTCNRTEIYFSSKNSDSDQVEKIFEALEWDKKLMEHIIHIKDDEAVHHLMDVSCGFDSIILGEDQILAQIKSAYEIANSLEQPKNDLRRLFQVAITCGKEFRTRSELNKLPVSSSSIAVSEAKKRKCRRFMILGFGEVGTLTAKYILSGDYDVLYIAVRHPSTVKLEAENVIVVPFHERYSYYKDVDCIISGTSAPHCVVEKKDLPDGKEFLIFDLAVPRDVEEEVSEMENVEVFDIDKVGLIDDENRQKRKDIMYNNKCILDEYIKEFHEWEKVCDIAPYIQRLRERGETVYKERYKTFKHKKDTKDNEKLAKKLLESTSNAFVNKAIEVLKEEHLKGRGNECLKIIEKIFFVEN